MLKNIQSAFNLFLLSAIALGFLSSCVTEKRLSFDVLTPAVTNLPPEIKTLALFNHAIKAKGDSAGSFYAYIGKISYDTVGVDTMLSYSCLNGLAEVIDMSERYLIGTYPSPIPMNKNKKLPIILPFDTLARLSGNPPADAAIVLEDVQSFDDFNYSTSLDGYYFTGLEVLIKSSWRIYALKTREIIYRQTRIDTVRWYSGGAGWEKAVENIPDRFSALEQASREAGNLFGKLISPSYRPVNRIYYVTDNPAMQSAAAYVNKGDWSSAARVWNEIASGKRKRLAALAAFNMALASESEGHLEIAKYWIDRSFELKPEEKTIKYRDVINDRLKQIDLLEKQLNTEK